MFIYLLAFLLGLSYIFLPFIAFKTHSLKLSNLLIFSGTKGKKLYAKRKGIPRKVINKKEYLKLSHLRQSTLGFFLCFLTLLFRICNLNKICMIVIILAMAFSGTALIGLSLNKFIVLH